MVAESEQCVIHYVSKFEERSMTTSVGPLDKRLERTRCNQCRARHLRCTGSPCGRCVRANLPCTFSKSIKPIIRLPDRVGLNSTSAAESTQFHSIPFSKTTQTIQIDTHDRLLVQFYTSFIALNSLTGREHDSYDDLQSLLHGSPGLRNAAVAISALYVLHPGAHSNTVRRTVALQSYRAALGYARADLESSSLSTNDSMLWCTVFLGIFELMYDKSGEGWARHFLYGTSRLLKFRGPQAHLNGVGRDFFLTVRIFEIARALIYSTETFLATTEWDNLMKHIWTGNGVVEWHPKETLYDLMILCADLGVRGITLVTALTSLRQTSADDQLRCIAAEGFHLRHALHSWKYASHLWSPLSKAAGDNQMTLALIYYHAISIYLSGLFDYHSHWNERHIPTAIISAEEVQEHVDSILTMTTVALKQTRLASVLFLFPLRVAGARARSSSQRQVITDILGDISKRSFVAADAFTLDLEELWRCRDKESGNVGPSLLENR